MKLLVLLKSTISVISSKLLKQKVLAWLSRFTWQPSGINCGTPKHLLISQEISWFISKACRITFWQSAELMSIVLKTLRSP